MATEQPNAEILVNSPPMILGATQPVFPDPAVLPGEPVVGLPLYMFRLVLNEKGVLAGAVEVAIDPPPHDGPGDDDISIEFILNDDSLETRKIKKEDRNERTKFNLFQASLLDGENNKVEYKVHRYSGNVGDSIPLWVLYSAHLPGGNDVPGNDDHPYLQISLPPELGNPAFIGKDDIEQGVKLRIAYSFRKKYDKCTVEMRRQRFDIALPPPGPDCTYEVTLTREMFERSGGSHPAFPFSYTIVDQLNNATDKFRWSAIITADVDMDVATVPEPILREVLADGSDDASKIDRKLLEGRPLLAVVVPSALKFQAGDTVEGSYTATPSGTTHPLTGTIKDDGFGRFDLCITEIPNDKVVLHDNVEAEYSLFRAGVKVGRSSVAKALVIDSETAIPLNPPTLVPPANNPINVLDYDLGVTVRVTFAGNPGDQARLKELNPAPGAVPFPVQDIVGGQSEFNLSQTYLAVRQNGVIELTWELIRGGVRVGESTALRLNVNRMIDRDPRLTTPTAPPGNTTTTLDLNSFTGNTTAQLKAWRGIALGQPFWLSCEGKNSSGATVTLPIYQGQPIGSVGDQSGVVTRAFLDQLADGSQISVLAAVNFDGVANEATAVKFPVRTYSIKAIPEDLLEFTNGPYEVAARGRVNPIHLRLSKNGQAIPNTSINLTLPGGFAFEDGGTGSRTFYTDLQGMVILKQVQASSSPGNYNLTANAGDIRDQTNLEVKALTAVERIPMSHVPNDIAVSPDGLTVYSTTSYGWLVVADASKGQEITSIFIEPKKTYLPLVSPDGTKLYVSIMDTPKFAIIDTIKNTLTTTININNEYTQSPFTTSPDGTKLYVRHAMAGNTYRISILETQSYQLIKRIETPMDSQTFINIPKLSQDGKTFYALQYDRGIIVAFDAETGVRTQSLTVPRDSNNLILSPDSTQAYIEDQGNKILFIAKTSPLQLLKQIPLQQALALIKTDNAGANIYFTDGGAAMYKFNLSNERATHLKTLQSFYSFDLSPDGNYLYVGSSTYIYIIPTT